MLFWEPGDEFGVRTEVATLSVTLGRTIDLEWAIYYRDDGEPIYRVSDEVGRRSPSPKHAARKLRLLRAPLDSNPWRGPSGHEEAAEYL